MLDLFRNGAVGFIDWLDCINLFFTGRLLDIKYHTVWVFDVAARDLWILLYHGATGCHELPLGLLNVWHKKVKDPLLGSDNDIARSFECFGHSNLLICGLTRKR